ncbi:hypothetical protein T439DRAFT_215504 [Meredithblackwellia eburnea MCA 4105]
MLEKAEEEAVAATTIQSNSPKPIAVADMQTAERIKPPSLSLVPPIESGESEGAVKIPPTPTSPSISEPRSPGGTPWTPGPRPRTRRQALLRPLFVYATLNPGLSYVQGMNSILAVLWWIFAAGDTSELEAEADAFFALGALLSQVQDLYVSSLDGTVSPSPSSPRMGPASSSGLITPTGLGATLSRYTGLLTWIDPGVATALENKSIDPALYVFRWRKHSPPFSATSLISPSL